jgi:hypothetical protein
VTTPRPTAVALLTTLALTGFALAGFAAGAPIPTSAYLLVFTCLFVLRVVGQVAVALFGPSWLPSMEQWNFVPYRILLPPSSASPHSWELLSAA